MDYPQAEKREVAENQWHVYQNGKANIEIQLLQSLQQQLQGLAPKIRCF